MPWLAGIITDLDGTLADTEQANKQAYAQAFDDVGLMFYPHIYDQHPGASAKTLLEAIAPNATACAYNAVLTAKTRHYAALMPSIPSRPALVSVLKRHSQTIPIGLVTSARRINAELLLQQLGLNNLFHTCLFAEDVSHPKPSPEGYLRCMASMAIPACNTLIFEDSATGLQAARRSGARVVRVPPFRGF